MAGPRCDNQQRVLARSGIGHGNHRGLGEIVMRDGGVSQINRADPFGSGLNDLDRLAREQIGGEKAQNRRINATRRP